jgi:hypothetical protein
MGSLLEEARREPLGPCSFVAQVEHILGRVRTVDIESSGQIGN